jgi:hypothetical protein
MTFEEIEKLPIPKSFKERPVLKINPIWLPFMEDVTEEDLDEIYWMNMCDLAWSIDF